jgi:hypothetical protein
MRYYTRLLELKNHWSKCASRTATQKIKLSKQYEAARKDNRSRRRYRDGWNLSWMKILECHWRADAGEKSKLPIRLSGDLLLCIRGNYFAPHTCYWPSPRAPRRLKLSASEIPHMHSSCLWCAPLINQHLRLHADLMREFHLASEPIFLTVYSRPLAPTQTSWWFTAIREIN